MFQKGHTINWKHGMHKTPEYFAWNAMRQRCKNKGDYHYSYYGGRGIDIDPRWDSFVEFYKDMGPRPSGYTLERKDNNRGYCKENCVWATPLAQTRNRRTTIKVTMNGISKPLAEWCSEFGHPYLRVLTRINDLGWDPIKAITTPLIQHKKG